MTCLFILASCGTSRNVEGSQAIEPAEISQVLKQPCADAQPIPDRITNGELIIALARDRDNLGVCRVKHLTLVSAINTRDEIQGAQSKNVNSAN